jgi:hypothetical protein
MMHLILQLFEKVEKEFFSSIVNTWNQTKYSILFYDFFNDFYFNFLDTIVFIELKICRINFIKYPYLISDLSF